MYLGLPNLGVNGGHSPFGPASLFAGGAQGAWFDPADFSTLFQDSAGTTPVTATGQPVGKILDKSGHSNHATQATATSRPTLQQDASGYYYLSTDGVDDFLALPHIDVPSGMSAHFAVMVTGGAAGFRGIWTQRNGTAGSLQGDIVYADNTDHWAYWSGNTTGWDLGPTGGAVNLNATVVASVNRDAGLLKRLQVVGAETSSTAPGYVATTKAGRLMAGNDADQSAGLFTPGRFYGGVIVAQSLAQSARDQVRAYLAAKSGASL